MNGFEDITFRDVNGNVVELKEGKEVGFRPGVYCFVFNSKNEILLIRDRTANGTWEVPGGGLELNEEVFDAVIREVKEETGYDIELSSDDIFHFEQMFGYWVSKDFFGNGMYFFFLGKLKNENRGESNFDEGEVIEEVKWVKIDELKDYEFTGFQKGAVKKFLEKYS